MDANSTLDFIINQKKEVKYEKDKRRYQPYIENLLNQVENGDEVVRSTITPPQMRPDGTYVCIREPEQFIHLFDDVSNSKEACKSRFQQLLDQSDNRIIEQVISASAAESKMWFNSSAAGINLRPGLQDNEVTKPTVVTFGKPDDSVHAIIVGATGSGKSVFLHNLLFSMMAEYAPWELNLFLVDFKKVSLSKYLSECDTPHVKAVAATSEVRYVVSLLQYLNKCMKARQTFLSYLGLEKLEELRSKYQIVLPRAVLLVDEFQQMFTEATVRESNRINEILTSITKLGRATGFHLVFASQEMNNTLGANAFANFKVRFALRCNSDVSSAFLGNAAAAQIDNRERGIVIENSVDGKEENNRTYKVPFVEEEGGFFSAFLQEQTALASEFGYTSVHKYYQEDFIRPFDDLLVLMENEKVKTRKAEIIEKSPNCIDIITLGNAVVFNYKRNDFETVFLESGQKRNIVIYSSALRNLIYTCKLIATNLKYSPMASKYKHAVLVRNTLFSQNYNLEDDLGITGNDVHYSEDIIDHLFLQTVRMRKEEISLIQSYDRYNDLETFAIDSFKLKAKYLWTKDQQDYYFNNNYKEDEMPILDRMGTYFHNTGLEDIPATIQKLKTDYTELPSGFYVILELLYKVKCCGTPYSELFAPLFFWIIGTELIDSLPRDSTRLFEEAPNYQVMFIFAASADSNRFSDMYNTCDYFFLTGNEEKMYTRWDIPFTKKDEDSIVIDFKVRSAGVQRSFKKFFTKEENRELPSLDFDELLE